MTNNSTDSGEVIISTTNLVKHFDISGGFLDRLAFENGRPFLKNTTVKALNDLSIEILSGETFCVVGESGCGKSTLGRTILGVYPPTSGEIYYKKKRIDNLTGKQMLPFRSHMQMVFQDPYASLNPRMTVRQTLEEPFVFHNPEVNRKQVKEKLKDTMEMVGVDPMWADRYPHEFSGGQRQRISIARALMVDPDFVVADEPISALDVSIQAQILNLLMDLQDKKGLTYMFITHDLSVVEHIGTRVAVMYLGTLCELSNTDTLFENPRHPYTKALLSAIPKLGRPGLEHIKFSGEVPTPINLPPGCVFSGRCPYAEKRCQTEIPKQTRMQDGGTVACHAVQEGRI